MKIDKQIHAHDFKLRLLLTNTCNQSCINCLNDFQSRVYGDVKAQFLQPDVAMTFIREYIRFCAGNKIPAQIYLSGGEPTLHPKFEDILDYALSHTGKEKIIINTNGTFSNHLIPKLKHKSCEVHFGVYKMDSDLRDKIEAVNGKIQCIFSRTNPYLTQEFLEFYKGFDRKIFCDFFGTDEVMKEYELFANQYVNCGDIHFRHTGIQENRGDGCTGCSKKCITLKALWVFPDNGVSPCPQLQIPKQFVGHKMSHKDLIENAYKFHKIINIIKDKPNMSTPDDIRATGWSVAIHNDYRLNGEDYTFWLFTKDGKAIKGEGRTDKEALYCIRKQLIKGE